MDYKKGMFLCLLSVLLIVIATNCTFAVDNEQIYQSNSIDDGLDMTIDSDEGLSEDNYDDELQATDEGLLADDGYEPDPNGIYVSPNGHNLNDGSYARPYKSIATAIFNAKDGKTIYLANGTYSITSPIGISAGVSITSYDGGRPVIDAQNKCSILKLTENCAFSFNGITFKNGFSQNGGVIDFLTYNQYTASFYNCTFINNTATNYGGVFYEARNEQVFSMTDKLFLISCNFFNNTARQGSIYYGGSNTFSSLTMQYCVALNNTNYAVYTLQNREDSVMENYWGEIDVNRAVSCSGTTSTASKLVIVSDNENPTVDDEVVFTAKLVNSNGADFPSNVYIPEIPITFTTTSGVLSRTDVKIINNKGQTVLSSLNEGNVTVSAEFYNFVVSKTVNVLPAPQYVSADAVDGMGDGSFNNPYSLKDAIEAVNNGAVNTINLFEGDYEFNEVYTLSRDVTVRAYSTPYKTDKVNIVSNNGFLFISENINANILNLTISNSNLGNSPLFNLQSNSTLNITNLIIKNNTLSSGGAIIANVENGAKLNIEYSLIVDNEALIQNEDSGYLFVNNGEIIADNNWWGSNQGAYYNEYLALNNEINSTKWVIISKVQQEREVLRTEWTSTFTIALIDNFNNKIQHYLPDIHISLNTNTGNLDIYEFTLNDVKSSERIKISEATSDVVINCLADNENVIVTFEYEIPLTEIFVSPMGDNENGDGSLEKPFLTLEKAISRAKESHATVYFIAGEYDAAIVCDNLFDNMGGGPVINNRNLTLSSYDGRAVFDRTNTYYLFRFGENTNVELIGMDFTNSYYTTGSKMGAIRSNGILTIANCSFSNVTQGGNFAEFIGISGSGKLYLYHSNFTNIHVSGSQYTNGALMISGSDAYAYIYDCYFANNGLYGSESTGFNYGNGESAFRCQRGFIDVINCKFENSSRTAMIYDKGRMNFKNCTFDGNGGLPCLEISSHGYGFNVTDCLFKNNKAGAIGVSIAFLDDNELRVYNCRFINNTAANGGAISLAKAGAVISNCYFEGNTAANGGAIYNSYASLLVEHCEFYNNTASNLGGSIYTEGTDDYIDIQYNIFKNSKANVGGVIYNNGITSLFYNIMTNGNASEGAYIYNNNRVGNTYIKILNNESISIYKNTTITVSALISDDMANPITGGQVTLKIDGKDFTETANEGIVSINYTFDKYGTFVIDGNYSGSRRYVVIVGTATVDVVKKSSAIEVSNVTVYYPLNGTVRILLKDSEGNAISNVMVIVNIDGDNYQFRTDENGTISESFNLNVGNHAVSIRFSENEDYFSSSAYATINVLSTINATDMVRGYNSGVDFKAVLLNTDGTPLANTKITFQINGGEYSSTSDDNGFVTLNQVLPVGTYKITIINPISNEKIIKTLSIVKRIEGNCDLQMFYMDGSKFKVRIVGDDGKYVGSGQEVIFRINNNKYVVKTDKEGYASLTVSAVPKTYTITAEYKGYNIANKLTVKQVLKASNVKFKKSAKTLKIKVSLKKVNGKYLKGKKITLKFKGKSYNAKTNKKGVATFKIKKNVIKKLKAGKKYAFKATYIKTTVKKQVIVKK